MCEEAVLQHNPLTNNLVSCPDAEVKAHWLMLKNIFFWLTNFRPVVLDRQLTWAGQESEVSKCLHNVRRWETHNYRFLLWINFSISFPDKPFGSSSTSLRSRTWIIEASPEPITGMPWGLAWVVCCPHARNGVKSWVVQSAALSHL